MEMLELIKHLLVIFGMIGPIVIGLYMLFFVWVKRCPLCGKKMRFDYRGGIVGYTCKECRHFEIKVLK